MSKKKVLMVLAPDNFKDEEFYYTKKILQDNKIEVETASSVQEAKSVSGKKQFVDLLLTEATTEYNGIIFVGGSGSAVYFEDSFALTLAKNFNEQKKVVAAICIAPSILANSGILTGKKATAFQSQESNLKEKGANYTGKPVEVDGKIVTAIDADVAEDFAKAILKVL